MSRILPEYQGQPLGMVAQTRAPRRHVPAPPRASAGPIFPNLYFGPACQVTNSRSSARTLSSASSSRSKVDEFVLRTQPVNLCVVSQPLSLVAQARAPRGHVPPPPRASAGNIYRRFRHSDVFKLVWRIERCDLASLFVRFGLPFAHFVQPA